MLTIKSKEIKNNAYNCLVSIVAFQEGYQVEVKVQYCTPYFHILEDEESGEAFLSREEAEKDFEVEVEWSLMLSVQALKAQESFMQKCMNDKVDLSEQKLLEEIHNCLSKAIPLELGKIVSEYSDNEVLVYQYFSLIVVEVHLEDGIGVEIRLMGETVYSKYTVFEDGFFVTPEEAIKDYLG